jgi:hypothetical protein
VPGRASVWAKIKVPQEVKESMSRTVAAALDYALDTLDSSPEEMSLPATLESLFRPNEPVEGWAIALWGDEKHSYDEVIAHLKDMTGCTHRQASAVVFRADEEVRPLGLGFRLTSFSCVCREEMSSKSQVMPEDYSKRRTRLAPLTLQ